MYPQQQSYLINLHLQQLHTYAAKLYIVRYHISEIIRGRKILRITFFARVRKKHFVIQAISHIKFQPR